MAEQLEFRVTRRFLQALHEQPPVIVIEPERKGGSRGASQPGFHQGQSRPLPGSEGMCMRMMRQLLAPGIENCDHSGLGSDMPRVDADKRERLEQDVIDVLKRDGGHCRRRVENETRNRAQAADRPGSSRSRHQAWYSGYRR